jgi:hypothetical protein
MSEREDADLGPRDRELVEWVGRHYAPPEETPARRAAFAESLRVRLEPRRRRVLAPALAAVAAACLVWWALPTSLPRDPAAAALDSAWEYELLLSSDLSPTADRDESRFLPRDYQMIASAFLGS